MTRMSAFSTLDPVLGIHVAGRWLSGGSGTFDVRDPADASIICAVADGDEADARAAVEAASAAASEWAATSPRERSEIILRVFEIMHRGADALADLITAENGKPRTDARAEVTYAAEFFRWYAEEAVRPRGQFGSSPEGGVRTIVTHSPVGVSALVAPWNFPAAMPARKIAPALAAGCTVVLKPAAETPLTALAIVRIIQEAGAPPGVVNVVPTSNAERVVDAWIDDERVRKLSFTGSTAVGRHLSRKAASRILNTSMELGGNAPFVVLPGTPIEAAVDGAMIAKFRGGGQACTAANRFYIHESVADEFTHAFGARVEKLVVGPGSSPETDIGPLISERAVETTAALVEDALSRQALMVAQAPLRDDLVGYFFAPTVLGNVPIEARVVREEIFGPVAPLVTWSDRGQLIATINGSDMGLAAYIYSPDLQQALSIAERLEVGMVGINRGLVSDPSAPFGGMKQSGVGREGGREGLESFQEIKYFSVDWQE